MRQLRKILCVLFTCSILQMIIFYVIIHYACMKVQGGQFMENLLRLLYGLQHIVNDEYILLYMHV